MAAMLTELIWWLFDLDKRLGLDKKRDNERSDGTNRASSQEIVDSHDSVA